MERKEKCIWFSAFFWNETLTGWPFCCADLDSLRLNISPPTEHSRHKRFSELVFGCIIKTPFVVRPSISILSCHFVAFSCQWQNRNYENGAFVMRLKVHSPLRIYSGWSRNQLHRSGRDCHHFDRLKCDKRIGKLCSAWLLHLFCRRVMCPWQQSQWEIRMIDQSETKWICEAGPFICCVKNFYSVRINMYVIAIKNPPAIKFN